MYFYSSTDKILNILLITSADAPKAWKPEISGVLRNFLVYYVK